MDEPKTRSQEFPRRESSPPRALVTGGARGLGRAIASRLLADGLEVVIADVADAADPIAGVDYLRADVGVEEDVRDLADELRRRGGVDVIVANAGIQGPAVAVTEYPPAEWDRVLRTNVTGAFLVCRALLPDLQARGHGRIITIASVAGKIPYPLRSAYCASKWALIGFTRSLAHEVGTDGITVNAVCPGPVENDAMENVIRRRAEATGRTVDTVRREYLEKLALPRFAREEDVASLVSYLVSDEAGAITGQAIDVSSGYRT